MRKTNSFRKQLNFLFLTIVFFTAIVIGFLQFHQKQNLIQVSIEQQAQAIAALISEDLARLIYFDEANNATNIISKLKQIDSLEYAEICDSKGQPLFEIPRKNRDQSAFLFEVKQPLLYQKLPLGEVKFIFYSKALTETAERYQNYLILTLSLLVLLNILFLFLIDKKFYKRIVALSDALRQTSISKDFSLRLSIQSHDEIGEAQQNFNQLIEMIETKTARLEFQANHDALTGLYSRKTILQAIKETLTTTTEKYFAVCYIDLDQFKVVNDTCGHTAGDQLLIKLSKKLNALLSDNPDTLVGRIGGDEFILLIKDQSLNEIDHLTRALLDEIRNLNFTFVNRKFPIGASIGVTFYQQTQASPEDILSAADAICYEAKEKGRNQIIRHAFNEENASINQQDMNLVSYVNQTLDQGGFELYLQPIVVSTHCQSETNYNHFEVLLRMPDQTKPNAFISPAVFIPVAERYGFSSKIDAWVVKKLFQQLAENKAFLQSIEQISINLSIATVTSSEMMGYIDQLFDEYQIEHHKICFEITETGVVSEINNAPQFIEYFKTLGVSFSLDDFGTGMSSFSYLHQLNVDILKIDGRFISGIESDYIKQEMVLAMSKIANNLNKKVVAEYVETEAAVTHLQNMHIDFFQGYFFSRPKPITYFINQV